MAEKKKTPRKKNQMKKPQCRITMSPRQSLHIHQKKNTGRRSMHEERKRESKIKIPW